MSDGRLDGLRVIVVDDEPDIRQGLKKLVATLGAEVVAAADGREALDLFERDGADVVLADLMMPRMSGADLLLAIKERSPATVVVILTGYGTIQTAVTCLQDGAAHFMTKPFENDEVLRLVERLGRQVLAARPQARARGDGEPEIIAQDPAMKRVMALVERVAPSPVPVLIEGESGTGKELVARAIHRRSAQAERPFLAVNAAALPDTLLESELFGCKKGAYTGADADREGIFVQAAGGTVFLDEISSMSPSFQGKLLRVLQEKTVRPLGGARDVAVEFRMISATNRDLEAAFGRGEFRQDLFFRLGVVRVHLPPLRERPADVEPLALEFLGRAAATCLGADAARPELSREALEALRAHPWPGNVRELENTLQRAVIVCYGERILAHHLGLAGSGWERPGPGEVPSDPLGYAAGKQRAIERFQREFVRRALELSEGNVSRAAQRCGLTRAALQRIMRQLDIERGTFVQDS